MDFFLFPVECDIFIFTNPFNIRLNAYFEFTCDYAKGYYHNNQLPEDSRCGKLVILIWARRCPSNCTVQFEVLTLDSWIHNFSSYIPY